MNPNHIKSISIAPLITLSTITAQAITTKDNSISTTMSTKESLPSSLSVETIISLYIATFGRTPNQEELNYWIDESGLSIEDIAKSFFDQPETQELYPEGSSSEEFVEAMYQNLFGHSADQAGLEYWVSELNAGRVDRSVFILALINGAQGADKTTLDEKTKDALEGLDDSLRLDAVLKDGDFNGTEEMWIRHKFEYFGYAEALKLIDDIKEIEELIDDNNLSSSEAREVRGMLYRDGIAAAKLLIKEYNPQVDPNPAPPNPGPPTPPPTPN